MGQADPQGDTAEDERVVVYGTSWCGYCHTARRLLHHRGIPFTEISLDDDPHFRSRLQELTGGWTVPQILIDGRPIGGARELVALDRHGRLEELRPSPR